MEDELIKRPTITEEEISEIGVSVGKELGYEHRWQNSEPNPDGSRHVADMYAKPQSSREFVVFYVKPDDKNVDVNSVGVKSTVKGESFEVGEQFGFEIGHRL